MTEAEEPRRILVVEDVPETADWIAAAAADVHPLAQLHVAASLSAARRAVARASPDLVLLDLGLPDGRGTELIPELAARPAPPRVVVLTIEAEAGAVRQALRAGVDGYLLKDEGAEALRAGLRDLTVGRPPISPLIRRQMLSMVAHPAGAPDPAVLFGSLTAREVEVARGLVCGESRSAIAARLGISVHTAAAHTKAIYRKLEIGTRAELGVLSERAGFSA